MRIRLFHVLPEKLQVEVDEAPRFLQLGCSHERTADHSVVIGGVAIAAEPSESLDLFQLAVADGVLEILINSLERSLPRLISQLARYNGRRFVVEDLPKTNIAGPGSFVVRVGRGPRYLDFPQLILQMLELRNLVL